MFGKFVFTLALALAAAAPAGSATARPARASAAAPPQLGAAVNTVMLAGADARYARTLLQHFASVTPEYEMEMSQIEPAPGRFTFAAADRIVAFAGRHGLPVRGHTLVWDEMVPGWVTDRAWTRPELEAVLRRYITTVVSHYRGRVAEWDVVNEPLTADGRLRRSVWERVIGPGYIALAFRWAHAADPHAALFVNEYGAEWQDAKERALHRLVARLRGAGVPVGGVGLQAHLSLAAHPPRAQLTAVLRSFAALGVRVEITELDVETAGPGPLARRLAEQASIYSTVASACRAVPACRRITTWGVTDAASWRGPAQRALPFAVDYRAKPAWRALAAALSPRG